MTPRPTPGLPAGSASAWQDATSGSGGYSGSSGRRAAFAAMVPLIGMFWLFILLGSLFAFGLGGQKPLAIVFFLAALAFLRRLFGRRRRGNGGRGPRGGRCGRRR